jgi:hypothetical protein
MMGANLSDEDRNTHRRWTRVVSAIYFTIAILLVSVAILSRSYTNNKQEIVATQERTNSAKSTLNVTTKKTANTMTSRR